MLKLSNDFWYNLNQATGKVLNPFESMSASTSTMASGANLGALGTAAGPLASSVALPFTGINALNQISEMGYKGVNPYLNDLNQEYKDGSFPKDILTAIKKPIGTTMLGGKAVGKAIHGVFKSTPKYDSLGKRLVAGDNPKGATLLMNRASKPSMLAKKGADVLGSAILERMKEVLNSNKIQQQQTVNRLGSITNQFKVPSVPQIMNPLVNRKELLNNPETWGNPNGLARFMKEVVNPAKINAAPVLKDMIQRGEAPKNLEQSWANLAMCCPVNAGFSNAVMRALSIPPQQATNLVSSK